MLLNPDVVTTRSAQSPITRRGFLQAVGLASARKLRSIMSAFTSIESQIDLWFNRCFFAGGLRYAGAG